MANNESNIIRKLLVFQSKCYKQADYTTTWQWRVTCCKMSNV